MKDIAYFDFQTKEFGDVDIMEQRVSGVYFIQAGESQSEGPEGPVKIGRSHDVGKRFAALQTAHYEELHILLVCGGLDAGELRRLESVLHRAAAIHRIRGEWFRPARPLLRLAEEPTIGGFRMCGFESGGGA